MSIRLCACGCGGEIRPDKRGRLRAIFLNNHDKKGGRHGMANTPTARAWASMRYRCNNPNASQWPLYGGRGIKVCDRWNSFENFLADMGERPGPTFSVDRIDNNGHYEPSNCRWADAQTQQINQRRTVFVEIDGESRPLALLVGKFAASRGAVMGRIRRGWDVRAAIETPPAPWHKSKWLNGRS